jgi:ElaB/YqjD/DUF883 family membrane-anchored ribosome-binding protein
VKNKYNEATSSSLLSSSSSAAHPPQDYLKDKANKAVDATKDSYHKAKENANHGEVHPIVSADQTKETIDQLKEKAKNSFDQAKNDVNNGEVHPITTTTTNSLLSAAGPDKGKDKEKEKEAYEEGRQTVRETGSKVKGAFDETKEYLRDSIHKATDKKDSSDSGRHR